MTLPKVPQLPGNSKVVTLPRKSRPRQIDGTYIPPTFKLGLERGFVPTSQNVRPVSVRGTYREPCIVPEKV